MFSQVCVNNSVHRGGVSQHALGKGECGRHHPFADTPLGRPPGQTPPGTTPPAAIAADGTHPTGILEFLFNINWGLIFSFCYQHFSFSPFLVSLELCTKLKHSEQNIVRL